MEPLAQSGLELLLSVLGAIFAFVGVMLAKLIASKVANEYLKGVLTRLNDAVFSAVKDLQQTVVDSLKQASADGTVSDEEKQRIKAAAIANIKSYLGMKGIAQIGKVLGLHPDSIDAFLGTKVEAAVHDLRQLSALSAQATSLAPRATPVPR